nr:transposase [Aureimonas sp. SK2]
MLLLSERGRKARPSHDNRQFLDGMLFVLRAGCPWRDMLSATESGTRSTSGFAAGPNRASRTLCWKRWSSWG